MRRRVFRGGINPGHEYEEEEEEEGNVGMEYSDGGEGGVWDRRR